MEKLILSIRGERSVNMDMENPTNEVKLEAIRGVFALFDVATSDVSGLSLKPQHQEVAVAAEATPAQQVKAAIKKKEAVDAKPAPEPKYSFWQMPVSPRPEAAVMVEKEEPRHLTYLEVIADLEKNGKTVPHWMRTGTRTVQGKIAYQTWVECECGHKARDFIWEGTTRAKCRKCDEKYYVQEAVIGTMGQERDQHGNFFLAKPKFRDPIVPWGDWKTGVIAEQVELQGKKYHSLR